MEVTTLIIAVFGAVTGAASLGWSVASYILSGGRVKVELLGGWVGAAGLVTGPLTARLTQPDAPVHEPILAVCVRNLGRLPVVVEHWSVSIGQLGLAQWQHRANQALPFTLAPGGSQTWVVPLAEVIRAAEAASHAGIRSEELRATVSLGSGKSRASRPAAIRTSDLLPRFGLSP
jgi:hypothetical protein